MLASPLELVGRVDGEASGPPQEEKRCSGASSLMTSGRPLDPDPHHEQRTTRPGHYKGRVGWGIRRLPSDIGKKHTGEDGTHRLSHEFDLLREVIPTRTAVELQPSSGGDPLIMRQDHQLAGSRLDGSPLCLRKAGAKAGALTYRSVDVRCDGRAAVCGNVRASIWHMTPERADIRSLISFTISGG